jgi:PST family polysaccharide transporter
MTLRQKAVQGVIWSVIQSWGRQAVSFIVFSLLARLLGPEAFGLVALAWVFLGLIQIFIDQGFADVIIQREQLDPEHLDTAFWTNLGIGVLLTVSSIVAARFVADLFNQPQLTPIIRWLSIIFLLSALSGVQEAIFKRNLAFKTLAIRELVAVIFGSVVGVTMAFTGFGVWSLVGQQLVSAFVQVLVLWGSSNWRPKLKFSPKHFKELFFFGINVVGIRILNFLNLRADNFLIGYFLGSVALGYYNIAYRMFELIIYSLVGVINGITMPVFSRLQQEPEQLRKVFYKLIRFSNLISFPIFLGLSALAPELVVTLFGEKWIPSILVLQILCLVGILVSFYFNDSILISVDKPSWSLALNLLGTIINIVAFSIAVRGGIVAVAGATVISNILLIPFTLWVIYKAVRIDLVTYLRQYLAPLAGTIVMVIGILGIKYLLHELVNTQALLAISIGFGIVVYPVTIRLIAPILFWQVIDLVRSTLPQTTK